jgi:hypothetical protein
MATFSAEESNTAWCNLGPTLCDSSWLARKKITLDNSAAAENLNNFPILVELNSGNFDYAKSQNSGQDIRFVDADGTLLSHEIETWNESGSSFVWVKVPQIDSGSTTDYVWVYYNNGAASDGQNAPGVWDTNYKGVWHLNDNAANTDVLDSTSVDTTLVNQANTSTKTATGKTGSALAFNGTSDYAINASYSPAFNTTNRTFSFWTKMNSITSTNQWFLELIENDGIHPHGYVWWTSKNQFGLGTNVLVSGWHDSGGGTDFTDITSSWAPSADTWYFVSFTYDGTTAQRYVNGSSIGSSTPVTDPNVTDSKVLLGRQSLGAVGPANPVYLNGYLDEVRVSNAARSADWIEAEYNWTNSPEDYSIVGSEETSTLSQTAYRWYQNTDAVQPTTALATENTAAVSSAKNDPVRLRIGVTAAGSVAADSVSLKLQYATDSSGPWTDIENPWWNSSWTARKKIYLDNSSSSENLVNFPALIKLSSTNIDYAKTQNSGQDVRFVDADGVTVLPHEIETWNEAGTSNVWVKVPQINASSTNDHVWMYYNNASASDAQNANGVWSSNFKGVWHLPDGTSLTARDSTDISNHGTLVNGPAAATGTVDGAAEFNATNNYIDAGVITALSGSVNATLSGWVYRSATNENVGFGQYMDPYRFYVQWASDGNVYYEAENGDSSYPNFPNTQTGWHYVTLAFDGSASGLDRVKAYWDGTRQVLSVGAHDPGATLASGVNQPAFRFGMDSSFSDRFFGGRVDEVRVSNVTRSADWIEAEYKSMTDTLTIFTAEQSMATSMQDVAWSFKNNATPLDGAAVSALLLASSSVAATYEESNSTALNPNAVANGVQAEFDFALQPVNAINGTTYFFRLVKPNGTTLSSYSAYPQIKIGGGVSAPGSDASGGGSGQSGGIPGVGGITHVQSDYSYIIGDSKSHSFSSLPAVGSLVVVAVSAYPTLNGTTDLAPNSVTDNQGNTYTRAVRHQQTCGAITQTVGIYYTIVQTSAGTFTVTADPTNNSDAILLSIHEYAGAAASGVLGQTNGAEGTSTTASSGNVTASERSLVFGALQECDDTSYSPGIGFTERIDQEDNTNVQAIHTEDRTVDLGTYSATWSTSGSPSWAAVVAVFKAVSPGSGTDGGSGGGSGQSGGGSGGGGATP